MAFTETVNSVILNADYFLLILLRTGALVISSPLFGRVNVPQMAKIGLIVSLGYLFFTAFPQTAAIEYTTLFGYLIICALEILIGIALAIVTNIFFSLTFTAGQLIDMQLGFGIVNVYDVQNNTQIPMTGNILNITLLIVFFAVDGHHRLLEILYLTMDAMPVGNLVFRPEIGMVMLEVFARSFTLGVMVALPVIASGLVLEIAFGMLIRTVPQMNMFVVGVPMKIFIGLFMLIMTIQVFVGFSERIFSDMFSAIETVFSTLAG